MLLGRLNWQLGKVVTIRPETTRAKSITLDLPHWMGHRAGQHVDVRLTAEDGYQAERSYSIASPPEEAQRVTLTVERIDDGEVSPYLTEDLRVGDQLELRGPIGGYFVWEVRLGGPLLLVAGGSGIVPLMAMLLHRAATSSSVPTRLLYSSRSLEDVIYRDEHHSVGSSADADPCAAAGMDGLYPPHRYADAARGGLVSRAAPAGVHLWPHPVRGNGCGQFSGTRTRASTHQDGTFWTNRRNLMENKLDGNAAAGMLQAIFPLT
jgi:Oxidoreductase FAD-binding domain